MTGFDFFDTNIVCYAKFDNDIDKRNVARDLMERSVKNHSGCISAQVAQEFISNAVKKAKMSVAQISSVVNDLFDSFTVVLPTPWVINYSLRVSSRYGFSVWDSFIVASALYAGCDTLYTEDLQNGQIIDGSLTIKNPFIPRDFHYM